MAESPDWSPIIAAKSAPAGPETVHPADPVPGAGALPAPTADPPVSAAADPPPTAGPHTLQTGQLGPLIVPDGAARAAEIEELSRRAAVYATRANGTARAAPTAWPGGTTPPGAPGSAANRSPPTPTPLPCMW